MVQSAQPSGCCPPADGRCPPAYGRCPPAHGRCRPADRRCSPAHSRPECLAAVEQLALTGRCLAPAGRPSRASLCPPRRGPTRPGVRSWALVGRGFCPATTARSRRMWVGGRSHGVPQRAGVKPVGWTVEYPGDGAARAVDLALHWRRPWSRGRRRTDRTAYRTRPGRRAIPHRRPATRLTRRPAIRVTGWTARRAMPPPGSDVGRRTRPPTVVSESRAGR